jgi:predicted nucleic acid-binding protein
MDTSAYTHLCRAGYASIIEKLAPGGVVLIPREVEVEIEKARNDHSGIPSVSSACWASLVITTDDEDFMAMQVKAALGGGKGVHLGESAVIACARHRSLIAVLDDRAAVGQAERFDVKWIDTLGIVVRAYKFVYAMDRDKASAIVDALIDTGMYLPFRSGAELFDWAYKEGILP